MTPIIRTGPTGPRRAAALALVLLLGQRGEAGARWSGAQAPAERDPFVGVTLEPSRPDPGRPPGLAGVRVCEIRVRGLMATPDGWLGAVEGSDGRTFVVRGHERLMDGWVESVAADGVVTRHDRGGAAGERLVHVLGGAGTRPSCSGPQEDGPS